MAGKRTAGWLLLAGLMLIGTGCSKQDTKKLGRLGRKLQTQAQALLADAGARLAGGFPGNGGSGAGQEDLGVRVAGRLRSDKYLAGLAIDVQAASDQVWLTGMVTTLEQRRRAVELAESTVGVVKVVDMLEMAPR